MAANLAVVDEHDTALEEQGTDARRLEEVFDRAKERFDLAVLPQLEQRSLSLAARRFATIPGAQWEGEFGDAFDNAIKLEINLTQQGLEKIIRDYNDNRIVPDFRPAGGKGDEESAATLDGLHRADSHAFKAQQARDNAAYEAFAGGFGAWRLTNEWADPYDKDNDHQRINPGLIVTDADQRVFFDPDSKLYDKSDAAYGFVITPKNRSAYEEEHKSVLSDWPDLMTVAPVYDWYSPDVIKVAEYYEVEDRDEKLYIATHRLSQEEQRYWDSEVDDVELTEMRKMGWSIKTRNLKRKRVHKYLISGQEVLKDQGIVAGDRIPIVPVYGKRAYIDGVERFSGYVQERMDRQRLYNSQVSRLAETSAQSPREIPIFAPDQMPPHLADMWAKQVVDRHAFALAEPLIDPATGQIVSMGPIGKIDPPQLPPVTAVLLQLSRNDLVEDQQDGADEVKANTSADALDVAATRIDAKSGIYLDNMRQSVQCEGEIYLSQCADVYFEPGREVETMSEDGAEDTAKLVDMYVDPQGKSGYRNDFTRGHYKVVADVTEATATRRDKTVKSCLHTAAIAGELGQPDLATAALITAVANQDGEGMTELQAFYRKKAIEMGLAEPNDAEKAEMEQAAAQQQAPDPQATLLAAKAEEAQASAGDKKASAVLKLAQAQAVGGPEAAPEAPSGLEHAHKVVQIAKTAAETQQVQQQTAHLPEKLAIERANAGTNRLKADLQARMSRFRQMLTGGPTGG